MGKASISIAISGAYNGAAIDRAEKSLERLAVRTAAAEGSMSKSWMEAGATAAEAGGKIYNTGEKIAQTGDTMTMGITTPLLAIGAASSKTAMDFESSMSRVSGALDDPSANMDELRQLALQMGADSVFSASEAGAAMEELAKGGLTAADIKAGALKTTMDLAAAGGIGLSEAANTVVQSMGAFNLSADQTAGAANALAGAAAASSADVSDLTQGLSQVSAQANSAGWSIQDTTAVLGAFADAGIKGSDAGTSLKTMLQRLSAPTDKAAGMMQSLGINVRDADGNMLDAASIAGELSSKMSVLDSATRDAAMQTIFGADASRAALVMMNQGTEGIRKYTAATNDQTAAQRLADSQMGATERAIEEMNGSIETASVKLGGALAPVVTNTANAVGKAADSFSELDEGTQSSIVTMGLMVAAAGPVLSVSGRIVKGVGSMCTAYGKLKQDVGVYADAMTTSNVKSLEAYASNSKLAKALEKNPHVKAAGGVKQYTDAVREANKQTSLYNSSVNKLERETKKGAKANQETVASLKQEVAERRRQMDAAKGTVQGFQQTAAAATTSTTAVTASSVAMKAAAVAGTALKAVFATMAPMLVIGGIAAIASNLKEVEENERLTTAATDGLVDATNKGISAANAGSSALKEYGKSAGAAKVDLDSVIESQAQLATTIGETNTSASGQIAHLQAAYKSIAEYANQSGLSADAQGKLKTAVQTVNDMTGSQIQVTDLVNGKLADENGAIDDVTTSIGDYVNKKIEQIRLDAQQQNLSALYQQQQQDIAALAQAQKDYNDRLAETGGKQAYVEQYMRTCAGATREMAEAAWKGVEAEAAHKSGLDDAKAALESCNTAIDNVTSSMAAQASAADGSTQSLAELVAASPTVTSAMNTIGGDVDLFAASVVDAGITVADFKNLNDEQLVQLVTSWDGKTANIVKTVEDMGIRLGTKGKQATDNLAAGMASGDPKVQGAASGLSATAMAEIDAMKGRMRTSASAAVEKYATGMGDSKGRVKAKADEVAGAASGINKHEGSAWTWGNHLSNNFAAGIGAGVGSVAQSAINLVNAAKRNMGFSVPKDGPFSGIEKGGETSGRHLAENFARGMRSNSKLVSDASDMLMESAGFTQRGSFGGGATYNYTLNINGTNIGDAPENVMEYVRAIFGEMGLTRSMGVR